MEVNSVPLYQSEMYQSVGWPQTFAREAHRFVKLPIYMHDQ